MDLYTIRGLLSSGKNIYDLPIKVTYYARVSTDREDQLNSLENQVMYFENFIKEQENWVFVEGYVDEGISGTSVKKRENFLRMIEDGRNGMFNLILTKEISRFSRNTLDSIKYSQELLSNGVGIHFMSDNINTFQPDAELRLTIMSSIAQEEIRKLSERIRFGYKRSVEKGVLPGSDNIYGYVKDRTKKGKLKIHEEEAELVRTIFDMYVNNNVGATKLGHILYNEHGIKSQTGKPLAGNVIANIIRNPKYKGYFCAHKETTVDYHSQKRKKFKPEEWIVYKDNETCPPIVSEEIWDKANAILKARSKKHEKHNPGGSWSQFPLSGKMICKHDGAKFIRGTYSNKNKQGITKKIFWACSQYRKYGTAKTSGCNSPVLHYEEMIKISNNILKDIITNKEELLQEINDVINEVKRTKDYKSEIKTINDKIKKLETEKKELIQMRMRKEIDTKEYNDMKEELVRLITLAESNLKKSEEGQKQNKNQDTSLSEFKDKINNLVLKDDASVLEIVDTLFKMIYIEKIEDTDTSKKTMLHIQLNIESYENRNISLDQLSLLFRYSNRCCYCNRKLCSRK